MTVVGYLAALLMGVVLGTLGGGGSVLTVPILVYLCHIPPMLASSYSLWVVGVSALAGVATNSRSSRVSYPAVLFFGLPSVVGVIIARTILLPALPETIVAIGGFLLTRDLLILLLFALLMVGAGVAMIHSGQKEVISATDESVPYFTIHVKLVAILEGLLVGVLTGMVGAGGGFMLVPALVMVLRLPIRVAIGTSLTIISAKSLLGVSVDTSFWSEANWRFLSLFTFASVVGIVVGVLLSSHIPARPLKRAFGWFVLVLGTLILLKELVV